MNPFYFGQSGQALYGVYHPPQSSPRDEAVVICPPFGQECMRSHRALRQLAVLLSKKGFHVLRFDYRGTGDSALDMDQVSADHWLDDIDTAIDELRDMAGVANISVLGLRLGALFAATACTRRTDIKRLILWDPILSGGAYLDELIAALTETRSGGNFLDEDGSLHFNGFSFSSAFQAKLNTMSLLALDPLPISEIFQAISHDNADFQQLQSAWKTHAGFTCRLSPAPHDWNFVDNFGGILLPQPVIQSIVNWMD